MHMSIHVCIHMSMHMSTHMSIHSYEQELKRPMINIVGGDLMRALLIQALYSAVSYIRALQQVLYVAVSYIGVVQQVLYVAVLYIQALQQPHRCLVYSILGTLQRTTKAVGHYMTAATATHARIGAIYSGIARAKKGLGWYI